MKRLPLAALACAALLAGCGGDDESSEPLSKAEFTAQGNKICRDGNKRAAKVAEPKGPAGLSRFVDKTRPIIEAQRDKLRNLEDRAPASVSAEFSKALDLLDQQIETFGEFKDAGTDLAKIGAVGKDLDRLQTRVDPLVTKIGLKACAE